LAIRHLQTSLHRIPQSRILRRPESRLNFFKVISLLKNHYRKFVQVAFLDAEDAENDFAWFFDTFKYRFIDFTKVVLKTYRTQIVFAGPFTYLKPLS
jgi:hypothetical protein